jgi:hypothetical protein
LRHNRYFRVTVLAALALLVHAAAEAQSRFHGGAALTGATEPSSTAADRQDRPGGTTWSGSALLGVRIRRGVFLELEPGMVGDRTDEYTYAAFRDADARVEWKRKEAFLTGQLRWKVRALEPVAGVRYIHTVTTYHATLSPRRRIRCGNQDRATLLRRSHLSFDHQADHERARRRRRGNDRAVVRCRHSHSVLG